jgi:phosphoglycerate dehydrogenase-like enzyme
MDLPSLVLLSRQGRVSLPAPIWSRLSQVADVRAVPRLSPPTRAEAVKLLARADLLGATNACLPSVDAPLLDALPGLRGLILYATGFDHLDLELLQSRGVGLCIVPDYATVAVAEQTVAMMMALASRLHLAHDRSRGLAPAEVSLRGVELAGRTLGVIGIGRIGARVAALANGLGMHVIGADTNPLVVSRARRNGLRTADLGELLSRSDVVSICANHRFGAKPIVNAAELAAMRPGSFLVNAARAALVDSAAAIAALRRGHLRGYAVDDEVGDRVAHADVLREGRLLQTGHSAWWRDETLDRGAGMWGERLIAAAMDAPIDAVTWPSRVASSTCTAVG